MADQSAQPKPAQPKPASSSSSSSDTSSSSDPKRGPGLAPIQGEAASDDRPAERQPGTREHLGDDPVYAGNPESPFVEGDADARDR